MKDGKDQNAIPFSIPTIDISGQKERHVTIASGTKETYQGHPTTVLMPDGKTMYCVWTIGHGGPCGPLKRSEDGGLTWSELLPVPGNWTEVCNCPSIYRLVDPEGKERLIIFAGGPETMRQAISEDGGKTWSPYRDLGFECVMAFCGIIPIEGDKHLGLYHRRKGDNSPITVWQSISEDGGISWNKPRMVAKKKGADPCEPTIIRSPNGDQLLALMRENSRKMNSLMMISNDEGQTWSEPREVHRTLTGDRHQYHYTQDGQLLIAFRDMASKSPTKGHFVAWLGKYEDILEKNPGNYRIKLLHNYAGHDCGYPGLELLPDGTFVATTYVKYQPGPEKHSVVSVRFKLSELGM